MIGPGPRLLAPSKLCKFTALAFIPKGNGSGGFNGAKGASGGLY